MHFFLWVPNNKSKSCSHWECPSLRYLSFYRASLSGLLVCGEGCRLWSPTAWVCSPLPTCFPCDLGVGVWWLPVVWLWMTSTISVSRRCHRSLEATGLPWILHIFQVLFQFVLFSLLEEKFLLQENDLFSFLSCTSPTPSDIFIPNFTMTADTRDVTTLQFRVQ